MLARFGGRREARMLLLWSRKRNAGWVLRSMGIDPSIYRREQCIKRVS
jgi:hypothetical protein